MPIKFRDKNDKVACQQIVLITVLCVTNYFLLQVSGVYEVVVYSCYCSYSRICFHAVYGDYSCDMNINS